MLATGFGSGMSPKMPGTVGSFAALFFFLPFAPLAEHHLLLWLVTLSGFTLIAVWAADGAERRYFKRHDVGNIVVDEFVGVFLTMTLIPVSWKTLLAGFVLFRLFDVAKPQPAKHIDRKWPGGWGVVMDDVVAGVYANLVMQALTRLPVTAAWLV